MSRPRREQERRFDRVCRPDDAHRSGESRRSELTHRPEGAYRVARARQPDEALPPKYGGRLGLPPAEWSVDLRDEAPLVGPPVPEILCTACGYQSVVSEGFCPSCGCYLGWHGETVIPRLVRAAAFSTSASVGTVARPTSVRPVEVKARPRRRVTEQSEPETPPGGPICRECHQANPPGRRFCRRCGVWLELIVVVVPLRLPWWRRLWNWLLGRVHRGPATCKAGERPIRRRRTTGSTLRLQLRRLAVVTGVLALVIPGIRQPLADAAYGPYRRLRHVLSETYVPVRPIGVEAETSIPDHPPQLVADGLSNTYWAEGAPGVGEGTGLTFTFSEPVKLYRLIVTAGASGSEEAFLNEPRPRVLHVVFDSGGTKDLVLEDVPTPQTFKFKTKRISKVEFHITLTHKSAKGENCAISEMEFFTKT